MHVPASDLAAAGRSTTFTFREAHVPATAAAAVPDEPVEVRPTVAPATARPVDGVPAPARLELVRHVVEQIVGDALGAAEIDAISKEPQAVAIAFDRARQVDAARTRVEWAASLELHDSTSGDGALGAKGVVRDGDGREVGLEVRITGTGEAAVLPLRLDVHLDADGRAERLVFAGRGVGDGAGSGSAATAAAWAGLPVRVHGADGSLAITTLADARAAVPGAAGGHRVDLVA